MALLALLLAGCAINPPLNLDHQRISGLQSQEIAATPFILQPDYQCGPASLAMVMNYYGADTTPQQLAPTVFTANAEGSFPAEMDAAIRRQGFISYPITNMEDLLLEIAAGHPVVTLQNLGVSWYPVWHYAVVIGFDINSQNLILRSGDQARQETGMHVFNTTWLRSQRWGRAIIPPHQIPATATPLNYLKSSADLDNTGPQGAAYPAYTAAVNHWPQEPTAHFALANFLLQNNRPAPAKSRFEKLLALSPGFAPGWNNYAYSLASLGCASEAIAAAQCANRLQPDNPAFTDTLKEMTSQPQQGTSKSCQGANLCPL